ncbi:hypothetical protein WG66_008291 [Moniliophthora roreri]|nr:hypothetical protein WG66_008291 [Moniliophthora roreri]
MFLTLLFSTIVFLSLPAPSQCFSVIIPSRMYVNEQTSFAWRRNRNDPQSISVVMFDLSTVLNCTTDSDQVQKQEDNASIQRTDFSSGTLSLTASKTGSFYLCAYEIVTSTSSTSASVASSTALSGRATGQSTRQAIFKSVMFSVTPASTSASTSNNNTTTRLIAQIVGAVAGFLVLLSIIQIIRRRRRRARTNQIVMVSAEPVPPPPPPPPPSMLPYYYYGNMNNTGSDFPIPPLPLSFARHIAKPQQQPPTISPVVSYGPQPPLPAQSHYNTVAQSQPLLQQTSPPIAPLPPSNMISMPMLMPIGPTAIPSTYQTPIPPQSQMSPSTSSVPASQVSSERVEVPAYAEPVQVADSRITGSSSGNGGSEAEAPPPAYDSLK